MLFYLNLIVTLFFLIYYVYKSFNSGHLLTMHSLVWFSYLVIIFLNPLVTINSSINNELFNLTFCFSTLGLAIACKLIPLNIYEIKHKRKYKYELKKVFLITFAAIYILFLVYEITTKVIFAGSIMGALTVNRLSIYLGESYLSGGSLVKLFMPFFQFSYYLYSIDKYRKSKYLFFSLLIMLPMIHHIFTANTRFDLIIMIVGLWVFIYQDKLQIPNKGLKEAIKNNFNRFTKISRRKVKIRSLLPRVIIIIGIVVVIMNYGNIIRGGTLTQTKTNTEFSLSSIQKRIDLDLNYYNFTEKLYSSINNSDMKIEYGQGYFYYPIISLIPRRLWSNKPIAATSSRLTESLYWPLGTGNPVVTFTIIGEGYYQFGYLGAFLAPIFFMYLYYILIRKASNFINSELFIIQTLLGMFTWFRGELPITTTIVKMVFITVLILFFSKKVSTE